MTLRLPPHLDAELRAAAEEDHQSLHQEAVFAVETCLDLRETAEMKADANALLNLAEARNAVQAGDILYGTDAIRSLPDDRHRSGHPTSRRGL